MNKVRLLQGMGMAFMAVCVLANPVNAQDDTDADADTIWVDGDHTVVIMSDDGRRVVIRGTEDGEAPYVYFDSDRVPRAFTMRPGAFSREWNVPNVQFFSKGLGDPDRNVTVLEDMLDGMGDVWVDHLGDGFRYDVEASMKERTEIMKMETESRKLAQRARRAEGEEKARLERELEQQLNDIFDRKQALREKRVERMRDEMNKALDQENERSQNREEIIERRLRQLLGKEDQYEW